MKILEDALKTETVCTLMRMTMGVGPDSAIVVSLTNPVVVDLTYDYSPAAPGCHTEPNGDPGEPGAPAEMELVSLVPRDDLLLFSDDKKVSVMLHAGADMLDLLDGADRTTVEEAVLRNIADRAYEHLIDRAMEGKA